MSLANEEQWLLNFLLTLPRLYDYRFSKEADLKLRSVLFRSLSLRNDAYLQMFFRNGLPETDSDYASLRNAQGAVDGAEYTAAAKGTACGHIFKSGESTYHCKTCAADDTCVLCSRCFESSDHEGHMVFISVSLGNTGCCDCGDCEAWRRPVACTIHTAESGAEAKLSGKERIREGSTAPDLPAELMAALRMTIARAVDYLCDVFSCSPEQMRLPKNIETIQQDERASRLSELYGKEPLEEETEYALVLWNDEKHTVFDVQNSVARASKESKKFGYQKAMEVNDVGRSIIHFSTDLNHLLQMAEIIEQLKVTITIRSSRDTFREQMCATIIDWISDISGCSVGLQPYVLRNVVCEELLKPWRTGSQASNKDIGQAGIDDHENEENERLRQQYRSFVRPLGVNIGNIVHVNLEVNDNGEEDDDDHDDDDEYDGMDVEEDDEDEGMEIDLPDMRSAANAAVAAGTAADGDMDVGFLVDDDMTEAFEATIAGYPPPPPPPAAALRRRILTPTDSDDGDTEQPRQDTAEPYGNIPRTPRVGGVAKRPMRPSRHWLDKPDGFKAPRPYEPCEDLWQRVRLDFLILYDLRLWKTLRIHLRHLYITTVVTMPRFKRILGLRFAGLYTALAQLYLIADREPDHSIINLSVQMLTTPTITQEVVERGNFLTNLMAILYTFLTTRQVGFPEDVSPRATLAFDAGAVTNRRMFHFFLDLRYLFQSGFIYDYMRVEARYLLQFLDLVKLHQGVCPNTRATGEHVEYESEAWISASMIVKEMNKLCKQVAISFEPKPGHDDADVHLQRAIRTVAQVLMINSFGYERKRFHAAETKADLTWHKVGPFENGGETFSVPKHVVQSEPMSFHHPFHYLLSWLIEHAKCMTREELRRLLHFSSDDLKDPWNLTRIQPAPSNLTSDDLLTSIFDHPLRVCVWLAQMKAGMWVRNGITLRHQAHTYRSVSHRDVSYQRDIFMVQAGLALCGSEGERPGERFLAQMIDRFQMTRWFQGDYSIVQGFEEQQQLDNIEDFFHLLIIALSERGNLIPSANEREQHDNVLQHDIAHALCFKPLSFSDLAGRVTEKVGDSDDFNRVLDGMATYRPPEGLNDTGTFELKSQFVELIDPYYAHYSRNHREEAENIYKKHMAKKTGRKAEDIVYEPILQPIESGLFANLASFTTTPLFAQSITTALIYAAEARTRPTKLQDTRIETFLHMVLHLVLLATIEDSHADDMFVKQATTPSNSLNSSNQQSVVSTLVTLTGMEVYASCHPTIKHILRKMQVRQPDGVGTTSALFGALLDRTEASSPASLSADDKERKKQEARARQARVMAQMKQQQNSFLQNQGLSGFHDDFDDLDDMSITEEPESIEYRKTWNFPTGTCIWCQEETDDQKLYGTFAFLGVSRSLRSTPTSDIDFVREVVDTPVSLDRPADELRPFGVAGSNKRIVKKLGPGGTVISSERQGLSKGFPHHHHVTTGPVATTCGHIMHWSCFELYMANSQRRHTQQIARNHPEVIELREFTCPLCKALGNTFLPIIWKTKDCAREIQLHAAKPFSNWLAESETQYRTDLALTGAADNAEDRQQQVDQLFAARASSYVRTMLTPSLLTSLNDLSMESSTSTLVNSGRFPLSRGFSLSRLFHGNRRDHGSRSSIDTTLSASTHGEQPLRMAEVVKAYHRIDDTIGSNQLLPKTHALEGPTDPVRALSRSLGLSISAFEIAHRGTASDVTSPSLLNDLSEQTLTHFRILSETVESYLAISILRPAAKEGISKDAAERRDIILAQLFGMASDTDSHQIKNYTKSHLLGDDTFLFFVDSLFFVAPDVAEASNMLQLCLWAEIVKVIIVYHELVGRVELWAQTDRVTLPRIDTAFALVIEAVTTHITDAGISDQNPFTIEKLPLLRLIIDKYALTFLRKSIILMHVTYGLDFECPYNINTDLPELDRLTALLHISSIDQLCDLLSQQNVAAERLWSVARFWISQCETAASLMVPHPAIFELVGLPKTYDVLTEEAIKRRCPTTGKEVVDPAVCLFCGDIFCSQAVCCMKDRTKGGKGGCHQHLEKCGGSVGLFINIRKCMVFFSHGPGNGSYAHAPYLDRHGEPDPTLRRHHQLFLNQRRYDKLLRDVWLQHLVPTVISRKLEGDINPGGWETL